MGEVLGTVTRSISSALIKKAGLTQKSRVKTGSVTFIQRFGGSLNLNARNEGYELYGWFVVRAINSILFPSASITKAA